ncbi:DeoR family transcriptional regulator [Marinomonas rhodophyticola]|uniref:DeoR family transcriptional regulator n=1 Tax=Marinomonas rhodophyticola TaxID=2992803 RepID=A0ABT3KJP7_9GAMM|nr:DeoR family transcriptional regulator [Marinomonas sp. KJ51-3]MCW4630777.1 DeoR family transcriptional regulator [Marinomonas sp. KJ51-3]
MSLNERQNQILNWVQQEDALLVEEMVARFNVSSQTIRKDINQLAERHLVRRTHGGIARFLVPKICRLIIASF